MTDFVNDYLAKAKKLEGSNAVRAMHFKRGGAMSIQGSESHYCSPKNNTGPYTAVEILVMSPRLKVPKSFGKPREKFDDGSRLYTFVQVSAVNAEIARRGGLA
jgi:hypothetical protein